MSWGLYAGRGCQVVLEIGTPRFACSQQQAIVQLEPAIGHTAWMSWSNVQSTIGDTVGLTEVVCLVVMVELGVRGLRSRSYC